MRGKIYCCRRLRPGWLLAVGLTALLLGTAVFTGARLGPVIRETAAFQARTIATRAVNRAVSEAMVRQPAEYGQLAVVTRGADGAVTSVQADMPRINALCSFVTEEIIASLDSLSHQAVEMPVGTLLGGDLLAGRGPRIRFYVVPTGAVETNVENRFQSAGINQTLHRIVLKVNIGILGVVPGYTGKTQVSTDVCLAETVIIGTVPEYYTQIDGSGQDGLSGLAADYGAGQNLPDKGR